MSLFKRIITLTLVLTMMTGCSFVNNAGAQKVFNFADSGYVTSLDASKAIDETSTNVIQAFGDGLYAYNVKSKLKPAIAKSMKVSDDGKTYTFEIRKNVKWSNGDPVTAEDFVYAWKRALSMRSDASKLLTSYGAAIAGADEIYNGRKSADTLGVYVKDKKLVVNLAYKTSRFMDLVTQPVFFPLNQKFVEAQGDQYATSPKTLLSCGTYKVSSISKDKITLKKNKTCYIAKKTNIDLVNMYFGISNEDKIKMFDEGKIDFAAVTGENAKKYDGKDSSTADSDSVIWDLVPNFKDQYLSDARVREAMSLLLERKKYNKQVLHDGSHKAQGFPSARPPTRCWASKNSLPLYRRAFRPAVFFCACVTRSRKSGRRMGYTEDVSKTQHPFRREKIWQSSTLPRKTLHRKCSTAKSPFCWTSGPAGAAPAGC